jgi:hypothetical protein
LSQQDRSDEGIELLQVQRAVLDAALVSVLIQKFRRGYPERVLSADSKKPCFSNLVDSTR